MPARAGRLLPLGLNRRSSKRRRNQLFELAVLARASEHKSGIPRVYDPQVAHVIVRRGVHLHVAAADVSCSIKGSLLAIRALSGLLGAYPGLGELDKPAVRRDPANDRGGLAAEHRTAGRVGDPSLRHFRIADGEINRARLQVQEGLRVDLLHRSLFGRTRVERAQSCRTDGEEHQHDDKDGIDGNVSPVLENAGFFIASHALQYVMRPASPLKVGRTDNSASDSATIEGSFLNRCRKASP